MSKAFQHLADPDLAIFQERRDRLAECLEHAVAFFSNPRESEHHRFLPNSSFYYLTGLATPGASLILWPSAPRPQWHEVLFLPPRDPDKEQWTGPQLAPGDQAIEKTGIGSVYPTTQLRSTLEMFLARDPAFAITSETLDPDTVLTTYLQTIDMLRKRMPALTIRNVSAVVDSMRRMKDPVELAYLQKAVAITTDALMSAMRMIRPGVYEYEVEAVLEYECKRRGAMAMAFPTIVGSGERGAILHYRKNNHMIEEGDLVVIDVGARYGSYCADITRTLPASGRFTPEQKRFYTMVLEAHEAAMKRVRPGAVIRKDIHSAAVERFKTHGVDAAFLHGTSHYLGIDVHDVGDPRKPLAPGVVLTVEPGLYFRDQGFGIRIEDDVLVTHDGFQCLSDRIPRSIDAIESIMQG